MVTYPCRNCGKLIWVYGEGTLPEGTTCDGRCWM